MRERKRHTTCRIASTVRGEGYLPWTEEGYLPWTEEGYLPWTGRGEHTLGNLPLGGGYLTWGTPSPSWPCRGVPTVDGGGGTYLGVSNLVLRKSSVCVIVDLEMTITAYTAFGKYSLYFSFILQPFTVSLQYDPILLPYCQNFLN